MEQTTEINTPANNKHICAHGNENHCCSCTGCGAGGKSSHHMRRWLALVIGVVLAFIVGMKLGEMKGLIRASYDGPMHEGRMMGGWREQR